MTEPCFRLHLRVDFTCPLFFAALEGYDLAWVWPEDEKVAARRGISNSGVHVVHFQDSNHFEIALDPGFDISTCIMGCLSRAVQVGGRPGTRGGRRPPVSIVTSWPSPPGLKAFGVTTAARSRKIRKRIKDGLKRAFIGKMFVAC